MAILYDPRIDTLAHNVQSAKSKVIDLTPSELVSLYFKLPMSGKLDRFSFQSRNYLSPIYDTSAKRVLLMFGRQCEKSTSLGNIMLTYAMAQRFFKMLFVAPTFIQVSQFSNDRLRQPTHYSEVLQEYFPHRLTNRVNFKQSITESEIRLRNAFLNADRIRGLSTDLLAIDEIQDIITDLIPIIEETMYASDYKIMKYSGTPKSESNTLARYWLRYSTMNEWVVPCRRHKFTHWQIIGIGNIPKDPDDGLVCEKCHKPINALDPSAKWVSMNPNPQTEIPYQGFRVPQLITPRCVWIEVLEKLRRYPRQKFFNEVLATPYDTGSRPITIEELKANCNPDLSMTHSDEFRFNMNTVESRGSHVRLYMGVDWGFSDKAYTYAVIGGYFGTGRFRIVYVERLDGDLSEPVPQMNHLQQLITRYRIHRVGADYGGGIDRIDRLVRWFGYDRIVPYQYVSLKEKIRWDADLGRYLVRRTEAMSMVYTALRRNDLFELPRWPEISDTLAPELLAIHTEYNESRREMVYDHPPDLPDDGAHALTYCLLASMIDNPRPDLMFPKEGDIK